MATYLSAGLGGTVGDSLALARPILTSGDVWYVHHDGVGNGADRSHPAATLKQLDAGLADGDIIVLMNGHTEEVDTTIAIADKVTIVGEGNASGDPTATLIVDHASNTLMTIGDTGVQIRNVRFRPRSATGSASTSTSSYLTVASTNDSGLLKNCLFEFDGSSRATAGVVLSADGWRLQGCRFKVTGGDPFTAMRISADIDGLDLDGVVFQGQFYKQPGEFIVPGAAFDGSTNTIVNLRGEGVSLFSGADIELKTGTKGYLHVGSSSGNAVVEWP